MYIYSMKESKMVVATVNAVKEVSQCAENSPYYKKLLQTLELPEFIHYDLALKYFLSAFKQIKHYVTVNGVFPTNDGKQYKLRQEMDFLCDVLGKKDGVECIVPWELKGDSLVIDNHADAELFMAVVNMVNAIEKLIIILLIYTTNCRISLMITIKTRVLSVLHVMCLKTQLGILTKWGGLVNATLKSRLLKII